MGKTLQLIPQQKVELAKEVHDTVLVEKMDAPPQVRLFDLPFHVILENPAELFL